MSKTCAGCRWKIEEAIDEKAVKNGEGFKARREMCTANPPIPISIVIMANTPDGPRPMQQIITVYPTVSDDAPCCAKHQFKPVAPVTGLRIAK